MNNPILTKDIQYTTELDQQYSEELHAIKDSNDFVLFLERWNYWLDEDCQKLKADDWERIKPLLDDTRPQKGGKKINLTKEHETVLELAMPYRLMRVSIYAVGLKVPWGTMYIRLRELNKIDF